MQTKSVQTALQNLGLSAHETAVYLAMLRSGANDATHISELAGLKRTTVYPILERLIEQEVVTYLEQGRHKTYQAAPPGRLVQLYGQRLKELTNAVPLLESLQSAESSSNGIKLITTKKEFRSFYESILYEYRGRSYDIIGSAHDFLNIDRTFLLEYRKRRAANHINVRLLLPQDSQDTIGQDDPTLKRDFRYLPDRFKFKSTIDIYDDKIVIIGATGNALAAVIAVPAMVDVFKSIFEALWMKTT